MDEKVKNLLKSLGLIPDDPPATPFPPPEPEYKLTITADELFAKVSPISGPDPRVPSAQQLTLRTLFMAKKEAGLTPDNCPALRAMLERALPVMLKEQNGDWSHQPSYEDWIVKNPPRPGSPHIEMIECGLPEDDSGYEETQRPLMGPLDVPPIPSAKPALPEPESEDDPVLRKFLEDIRASQFSAGPVPFEKLPFDEPCEVAGEKFIKVAHNAGYWTVISTDGMVSLYHQGEPVMIGQIEDVDAILRGYQKLQEADDPFSILNDPAGHLRILLTVDPAKGPNYGSYRVLGCGNAQADMEPALALRALGHRLALEKPSNPMGPEDTLLDGMRPPQ